MELGSVLSQQSRWSSQLSLQQQPVKPTSYSMHIHSFTCTFTHELYTHTYTQKHIHKLEYTSLCCCHTVSFFPRGPPGSDRSHPPQYRDSIMTDGLSHTWQHTQQTSRCTATLWAHTYTNTHSLRYWGQRGLSSVFAELEMLVCTGAQVVEGISVCNFLQTLYCFTQDS